MTKEAYSTIKPLVMAFLKELMTNYWGPLYHYIQDNPELIGTVPGFFVRSRKINCICRKNAYRSRIYGF